MVPYSYVRVRYNIIWSFSVKKDNSENTRKNALFTTSRAKVFPAHLQHVWHKCFLICNTSVTSAFSFATSLAKLESPVQHPSRSWWPCNIPAALPLQHLHRICCHLQHLCSVGAPATSLQCLCACNIAVVSPLQLPCCSWCLGNIPSSVDALQHLTVTDNTFFTPLFVHLCTKKAPPPTAWYEMKPLKNQWARSR